MPKQKSLKIDIVKIQMVRDGSIEYGRKPVNKPQELAELGLKLLKTSDRENLPLVYLMPRIREMNPFIATQRPPNRVMTVIQSIACAYEHQHTYSDPQLSSQIEGSLHSH